ncbi:class I SAM-dependent methyltransferase [Pseudodesulfovibrio sp.]|nr:class I SAM-dependent methyltransferase [Pseudodesulfovibrio sp.]
MSSCIVCKAPDFTLFEGYGNLPRVGSDSSPLPPGGRLGQCSECGTVQKPFDDDFLAECDSIYSSYVMYAQSSDGADPKVFVDEPCGRSTRLVLSVAGEIGLGETGRFLDVGCGNGNLLRAFKAVRPDWTLAGLELDDRHREAVEATCGLGSLMTGDLATIRGEFNLIAAMHVLEHITSPTDFLLQVKERLTPDGHLVIQLPLWQKNPFDLIVADHVVHFDRPAITRLLSQAGLTPVFMSDEAVPRELTVIARVDGDGVEKDMETAKANLALAIDWLTDFKDEAARVMERVGREKFGIFGTGNAAMWLTQGLDGVGFYVDDDASRRGTNIMTGKPVYGPDTVPKDATVAICLPPELSAQVHERVKGLPVNWLVTPSLEI